MLFKGDYDGLQSALGSGLFYLVDEKSVAPVYAIEKANGGTVALCGISVGRFKGMKVVVCHLRQSI